MAILENLSFILQMDFLTKYGVILCNFFFILVISVALKLRKNPELAIQRKNILFVIAHPDDESM